MTRSSAALLRKGCMYTCIERECREISLSAYSRSDIVIAGGRRRAIFLISP